MTEQKLSLHAVILAGGRGTRFWPRSRTRTPKQLLTIVGKTSMLEQTVARLRPLIPPRRIWSVTNAEQATALRKQLPSLARQHVLAEPVGKNTAAAIALAAIHIRRAARGDALMAVLPADHFIRNPERYREIVKNALIFASEPGRIVVLGVSPTHPETGYGYVERTGETLTIHGCTVFAVRRFTEKPALALAKEYVASGNYHWNAGMFFWRVSTYLDVLKEFLPQSSAALEELARHIGKPTYESQLKRIYPRLEDISVDYAVLERATRTAGAPRVFVIPAEIGWSDVGSWAAVYELQAKRPGENIYSGPGYALDAEGNFFWAPGKLGAAIGVHELIGVETPDALLICPRSRAQDVGKIVKELEARNQKSLF